MTAKYQLIHAEEGSFPVRVMCRLLGIALSGYYAWKKTLGTPSVPGSRAAFRERLKELVWRLWDASQARFGFRRIRHRLAVEYDVHASEGLVRRVMRELGIEGVQPRARKTTTVPSPEAETRQDLVRRRFTPPVPTTHLVGDITYLKTGEGWLFLATVIDLTTRMVVGWQMAPRMTTDLATDALRMAHAAGYVAGGAVFHSDRGAQYTSAAYAEAASEMGVRLSVGRTGGVLGQRGRRVVLRDVEERDVPSRIVRHTRSCPPGGRGVHRGVLQPEAAALDDRLSDAGGDDGRVLRPDRTRVTCGSGLRIRKFSFTVHKN